MARFWRCTHLSLIKPTYTCMSPLKLTYTTSRIVQQTSYSLTLSCFFTLLKPTCSYLCSLFSLNWSLEGSPYPPIQDLLESESFLIQSCLTNICIPPSPYPCFYNMIYDITLISKVVDGWDCVEYLQIWEIHSPQESTKDPSTPLQNPQEDKSTPPIKERK